MKTPLEKQTGITLIATLFLLVVVSSIGAYMVKFSTAQHVSSAATVSVVRARYALLSGLEWMQYELSNNSSCPVLPKVILIDGYRIDINTCNSSSVSESGVTYHLYDVALTASRGVFGDIDYTQLGMRATLKE